MQKKLIKTQFVEFIPEHLEEGILYVTMEYCVAVHKCGCGCGEIIVTPLDKKHGWVLSYDGKEVSLHPSIGNYSYNCRSHYWIKDGKVLWVKDNKVNIWHKFKVFFKRRKSR